MKFRPNGYLKFNELFSPVEVDSKDEILSLIQQFHPILIIFYSKEDYKFKILL